MQAVRYYDAELELRAGSFYCRPSNTLYIFRKGPATCAVLGMVESHDKRKIRIV